MTNKRTSPLVSRELYDAAEAERIALVQVLHDVINRIDPTVITDYTDGDGDRHSFALYRPTGAIGGLVLTTTTTTTDVWVSVTPLDKIRERAALSPGARFWLERAHAIRVLTEARDRAFERDRHGRRLA